MTPELKEFIEDNIRTIEDCDLSNTVESWINLFNLFYETVYENRELDYNDINILLYTLQSADIGSNVDLKLIAKGTLIAHDAHKFEKIGNMHGLSCETEWSRFSYLFENQVEGNINPDKLIAWMKNFEHELKLDIRKLETDRYTYDPTLLNGDEYDLGWFDESDFDEVYAEL